MSTFLSRPQNMFLRKILFQIHLWTGIAIGLYILVVCVTGAALVFRIHLQRAEFPHLFTPTPGEPADMATFLDRVRDAFPNDRVSGIDAPTGDRPTALAYVVRGARFLTILIDPTTGRILGELPDRSIIQTIQALHFGLGTSRTGHVINGLGAALLFLMCVTGLVIWWPGIATWRRGFTIDFRRGWKRVNWELHSAVGVWTVALIAMWAVTGVSMVFSGSVRKAVNAISPLTVVDTPRSNPSGAALGVRPTWRELIARAQQRFPDQYVQRVVLPPDDMAAFLVMFSPMPLVPVEIAENGRGGAQVTSVYLDQYTGEVVRESPRASRSAGDFVIDGLAWLKPLHFGNFGGIGVRVAWLLLGLAPPALFVTGFIMWWSRVVRPRWLATGRSPAREV